MENTVTANSGSVYIPYEERSGEKSVVFFTRDLSPEGLQKIFKRVSEVLEGKICVKVHTGEKNGPNIIPCSWIAELFKDEQLKGATIIETNTLYDGDRGTTEKHLETLQVNGWTFSPVDIIDAEGDVNLPVNGGKWFTEMAMGKNLVNYDSLLTLTHFKGHTTGGFGGSAKNLGIGCASGKVGKDIIHNDPAQGKMWSAKGGVFMERMVESTKAVVDFFGKKVCYVNVMRNMSVSCDCEGLKAQPVVTPNVGICASLDLVAVDQACVDLVYAMKPTDRHALVERIESREGHRQLSYMQELGMGNTRYKLIDIDNNDAEISFADAVAHVKPFVRDEKKAEDVENAIKF